MAEREGARRVVSTPPESSASGWSEQEELAMSLAFSTMAALRFGYGFRAGETPPPSVEAMLAQLDHGAKEEPLFPTEGVERRRAALIDLNRQLAEIRQDDDKDRQQRRMLQRQAQLMFQRDANARLLQAVISPHGFYERLASFWTDHFAVSAGKSLPMRLLVPLYEAAAIRPHIGGKFATLLQAAITDPAMLIYLDQAQSFGPQSPGGMQQRKGLNENLGRELLELHTIGAGSGYAQADVRSASLVLTGLTIDRRTMETDFRPRIAEPGAHDVLGINYGGRRRRPQDYRALLEDLAIDPRTARHISRKLAVHFVADEPPRDLVEAMEESFKRTDGDLRSVYATLLGHPAAWREEGTKARQPFDFVVTALRALDAGQGEGKVAAFMRGADEPEEPIDGPMAMAPAKDDPKRKAFRAARALGQAALRRMGQPIWLPPSPAGFDEGFDAWVTAGQLSERLAWVRRAAAQFGDDLDPRAFLKTTLADAARDSTIRIVNQAPNQMSGLTLVLASPEFNRR